MPELPEVTVITNQLNKKLKGLEIKSIEYDWPKKFHWGEFSIKDLKGAKVSGVERRGKIVIIRLVSGSVGKWDSRKNQTDLQTYRPIHSHSSKTYRPADLSRQKDKDCRRAPFATLK